MRQDRIEAAAEQLADLIRDYHQHRDARVAAEAAERAAGDRLAEVAVERGLTVRELAAAANIPAANLGRWMRQHRLVDDEQ